MTYVHRIRKPKVGTFTSLLRQLSQEQLLSIFEIPTPSSNPAQRSSRRGVCCPGPRHLETSL